MHCKTLQTLKKFFEKEVAQQSTFTWLLKVVSITFNNNKKKILPDFFCRHLDLQREFLLKMLFKDDVNDASRTIDWKKIMWRHLSNDFYFSYL